MTSLIKKERSVSENLEAIAKQISEHMLDPTYYEQAIQDFSTLAAQEPFHAGVYRDRGHRYLGLSRFEPAIADLVLSTRLDPTYWKNWDLLGMANFYLGNFEQAIGCYDQGLFVTGLQNPYTAPLCNWKYICYCHLGKKDSPEAQATLHTVTRDSDFAHGIYKNLLMLHQGALSEEALWTIAAEFDPMLKSTFGYAIAAKEYFDGNQEKAKQIFDDLLAGVDSWCLWGHKACEIDRVRLFA